VSDSITERLSDEAEAHYNEGRESTRLSSPAGQLEFVRTTEIIARYLPTPPAKVLDIGGGAGNYSFWLAERGYTVHLVDIVPLHIEQVQRQSSVLGAASLTAISLGDACHLDFADESAQVTLLLGPLYHLTEKSERLQALREAHRVLTVGGVVFVAAISRFASALDGLFQGFLQDPDFRCIVQQDLINGQHRNPTHHPAYFTTAFLHHPDELESEVTESGFELEHLLAIEGAAWLLPELSQHWNDDERREILLDTIRKMESDASILGISAHILAVGRKS
jgi:ubiquinone/menaquinone biosynthesis C-methylase UbiE